uniref:Uracil phosphoribosyltransferase n=1 Tax=Helminthora furcellata TaxID=1884666 RepID=A0A1G4NRF9_9FLOR|nr:Uracil phosphoribosyltransferase [Helminthora furcellata]SCW21242.1 Uracil phosphoribosyltransferase [Helminthora furcellata]SCW24102.1 Uracil phosphoribosyltransferase [Helminthora furcellata]
MPINIYAVKHPLIFTWINHLIHNKPQQGDTYELIYKIHLTLIYEACRKTIQHYNLYIKYIDHINQIWLIKNNKIHIFCTDNISTAISKDILYIIPKTTIHNINLQEKNNNWSISHENNFSHQITANSQIVIIEEELLANRINSILNYINAKDLINTTIQICCTHCDSTELDKLGQQYSQLDVYTAYITNTLSEKQMIRR